MQIKISLIQTSQNRKSELARFIESLNRQVGINFGEIQLIFIDQEDNRSVFKHLNKNITFTYIKYKHCSLSHARNIGLKHVKGEYIGFPDDDCWYKQDTLEKIFNHINNGYSGVIAKSTDETGVTTNKSPRKSQRISLYNHCGAISYTIFLKFVPDLLFDEKLGVGSPYQLSSGEETDYLIRFIKKKGANIYYDCNIIIHHPKGKHGNFSDVDSKQYEYARGWGFLLRKHHFPIKIILKSFIRPICGILFYSLTLNKKGRLHSYHILKGRLEGYIYK